MKNGHSNIIIRELNGKNISESFMVKQDEKFTLVLLVMVGTKYEVTVKLSEPGAQANILGLIVGRDADQITIHTTQQHTAPNTLSDLLIKSTLSGRSFLGYEGFIRIEKKAQHSNAYQRNDNLLLSREAKAESKPALEILANDVRCTHGATLGKINEEQLFYLTSRGISRKSAQELIISGFFQGVIDKIPDQKAQNSIIDLLRIRSIMDPG